MSKLTHIDEDGNARMVDISKKSFSLRVAEARGFISVNKETFELLKEGKVEKGNVFSVSRVAGIMAAKKTADLIPLTHPLKIEDVEISFEMLERKHIVQVDSKVKVLGKTGVEMEALIAVSMTLLSIYDMCKATDKEMIISDIHLVKKKKKKVTSLGD